MREIWIMFFTLNISLTCLNKTASFYILYNKTPLRSMTVVPTGLEASIALCEQIMCLCEKICSIFSRGLTFCIGGISTIDYIPN